MNTTEAMEQLREINRLNLAIEQTKKTFREFATEIAREWNELLELSFEDAGTLRRKCVYGEFDSVGEEYIIFMSPAHAGCCPDDYYYIPLGFVTDREAFFGYLEEYQRKEELNIATEQANRLKQELENRRAMYETLKQEFEGD